MLVLSRRAEQVICIGESIRITIVKINKETVKVGITAPREFAVHRLEIYERIQAQIEATDSDSD